MTGEREGTPRLEPCPFCGVGRTIREALGALRAITALRSEVEAVRDVLKAHVEAYEEVAKVPTTYSDFFREQVLRLDKALGVEGK